MREFYRERRGRESYKVCVCVCVCVCVRERERKRERGKGSEYQAAALQRKTYLL